MARREGGLGGPHELAQAAGDDKSSACDGAWVHAYLHRKEGDGANAAYWYARAGQPVATGNLVTEWRDIAVVLLASASAG